MTGTGIRQEGTKNELKETGGAGRSDLLKIIGALGSQAADFRPALSAGPLLILSPSAWGRAFSSQPTRIINPSTAGSSKAESDSPAEVATEVSRSKQIGTEFNLSIE